MRILRAVKNLIFFMLTLVLVCAFIWGTGEALVYFVLRKDVSLFPRYVTGKTYGEYQIRTNIPGASYRHKSYDGQWQFHINHQGFRDEREFAYAKKPGVLRILTLGDSFTIGFEVAGEETYSAQLEKKLQEKGIDAEVINSGVSGFSTAEELVFLKEEGLKYHPDIVILGFYQNDLGDNIRADLFRYENGKMIPHQKIYLPAIKQRDFFNSLPAYRWLSENSYLHNYLNMMATLLVKHEVDRKKRESMGFHSQDEDSKQKQESYEMQLSFNLVGEIHKVTQTAGASLILLDIPTGELNPSFPRLREVNEIADIFLDASVILRNYGGGEALYQPHGQHHWTARSHELVAERLADLIVKKYREQA